MLHSTLQHGQQLDAVFIAGDILFAQQLGQLRLLFCDSGRQLLVLLPQLCITLIMIPVLSRFVSGLDRFRLARVRGID